MDVVMDIVLGFQWFKGNRNKCVIKELAIASQTGHLCNTRLYDHLSLCINWKLKPRDNVAGIHIWNSCALNNVLKLVKHKCKYNTIL